uniref:Replication initiator protein n=1 Tax=Dulem virus 82 TaxID=3145793 RepID=A0AAU8BAB1_9VIRU
MCLNPQVVNRSLVVPCGRCIECLIRRSNEWAWRVSLEAKLYKSNCMVTLTYSDDYLPQDRSVSRREFQLFLKSIRKAIEPVRIRYFGCGEYGEKYGRPHYHIILFGYDFPDKFFFKKDKKGIDLYRSPSLEKIWKKGFSSVCEVNYDVAKYVAVYLQKKMTDGRKGAFVAMSLKPGIGALTLTCKNVEQDRIYLNGRSRSLPRYFVKYAERQGLDVSALKTRRVFKANKYAVDFFERYVSNVAQIHFRKCEIEKKLGIKLDKYGCIV